jgi:hypothetical protein
MKQAIVPLQTPLGYVNIIIKEAPTEMGSPKTFVAISVDTNLLHGKN